MDENPYFSGSVESETARQTGDGVSNWEVCWAWEKRRLIYNVILGAVTIALSMGSLADRSYWRFLIEGALAANLAFCLGPLSEVYLARRGGNRRKVRTTIFVIGTGLGVLLTVWSLFVRAWDH